MLIVKNNKRYYRCNHCAMVFKNRKIAQRCEVRCAKGSDCHERMIKRSLSF